MIMRLWHTKGDFVQQTDYPGYEPIEVPDDFLRSNGTAGGLVVLTNAYPALFPPSRGKKRMITHFSFDYGPAMPVNSPALLREGGQINFPRESITMVLKP